MGIKGTVRRSTDGHIIHANIDTDVIIAEEPPYGEYFLQNIFYSFILYSGTRYCKHEAGTTELALLQF